MSTKNKEALLKEYKKYLFPNLIWRYEQNKPSLIAEDLHALVGVDKKITHTVLLARGVYKWLGVRRKLIKLKNNWKKKITETQTRMEKSKKENHYYDVAYTKGYMKAYVECRQELRKLCHSERWQAPDFDKEANNFLKTLEVRWKRNTTQE